MTSVRLAACKCIAGGASSLAVGISQGGLGWSLALEPPERPGLAAGMVARFQRGLVRREQEGHRWVASANANTRGVKTGKICRDSMAAVLAIGSFSG